MRAESWRRALHAGLGLLCTIAGFALAGAGTALAEEAQSPPASEEPSIFAEAAEPLGLTPDQVTKLERLSAESHEHASMLRAERRALQGELNDLLRQDEPSIDDVMAYADELGVLDTRIRKHHLASLLAVRAVLTPEQRRDVLVVVKQINDRRRAERERASAGAETAAAEAGTAAAQAGTPPGGS